MSFEQKLNRKKCVGFTLVELLVLIAILVTVSAILIPSVKFLLKDRKIREATRVLNAFVVQAQTEALNDGFGGIWIERDPKSLNTSTRVYRIKSPPPYTGDFAGSTCNIDNASKGNGTFQLSISFPDSPNAVNLIRPGDLIQFDLKGTWFIVQSSVGGEFTVTSATGPLPPVTTFPFPVKFKVLRMPTRQTGSYVDMPRTTMIDLSKSGLTVMDYDGNGQFDDLNQFGRPVGTELSFVSGDSIRIIFAEDGSMQTVIVGDDAFSSFPPDRSIHLLLASDERETVADADPANSIDTLLDGSNFWLTITRQGAVSTSQVSTVTPSALPGEMLRQSRMQARQVETTGGG